MEPVVLGLGASLGDRARALRMAVAALYAAPGIDVLRVSRTVVSRGIGPARGPFLNAAVLATTSLQPMDLLERCKAIERRLGRQPARRWGDRAIDIDILLLGARTIRSPRLEVPHVAFLERPFALEPAREVAPDWIHPVKSEKLRYLSGMGTGAVWRGPGLGGRLAGIRRVR